MKPILLFSGGLDSTTLLWQLIPNVKCISFEYGQRHYTELDHAINICRRSNIEQEVVSFTTLNNRPFTSVSKLIEMGSQTGYEPVPEGHYTDESMKKTVVPNRNMIMLSIAVGWAVATGSREVFWAAHAGDHAIYPDCRPDFYSAMYSAIMLGNEWNPVALRAPFINETKAEIVRRGIELNVPYELTWSCYKGESKPCGKCGTCVERLEAFKLNNATDPLEYA